MGLNFDANYNNRIFRLPTVMQITYYRYFDAIYEDISSVLVHIACLFLSHFGRQT